MLQPSIRALRLALLAGLLAAPEAFAQEAQKPVPPTPAIASSPSNLESVSSSIVKLQRDILLNEKETKANVEQYQKDQTAKLEVLQTRLRELLVSAGKFCPTGKIYDSLALACQDPQPAPVK